MEKTLSSASWSPCANFLRCNTLAPTPECARCRAQLLLTNPLANLLDEHNAKRTDMLIYTRNNGHRVKWILAFVVFVLVMSVTFDDVYGVDTDQQLPDYVDHSSAETPPPPEVPEPTTLILLASGLVALRLMYRKRH
jgi:hypothetical protein